MDPGGLAYFQAATLVAVPGVERMSVCGTHPDGWPQQQSTIYK